LQQPKNPDYKKNKRKKQQKIFRSSPPHPDESPVGRPRWVCLWVHNRLLNTQSLVFWHLYCVTLYHFIHLISYVIDWNLFQTLSRVYVCDRRFLFISRAESYRLVFFCFVFVTAAKFARLYSAMVSRTRQGLSSVFSLWALDKSTHNNGFAWFRTFVNFDFFGILMVRGVVTFVFRENNVSFWGNSFKI